MMIESPIRDEFFHTLFNTFKISLWVLIALLHIYTAFTPIIGHIDNCINLFSIGTVFVLCMMYINFVLAKNHENWYKCTDGMFYISKFYVLSSIVNCVALTIGLYYIELVRCFSGGPLILYILNFYYGFLCMTIFIIYYNYPSIRNRFIWRKEEMINYLSLPRH